MSSEAQEEAVVGAAPNRSVRTLWFGSGFALDPARFELRRGGVRLQVQPKVLRLLFYLIEQRARVVPADELLRALWPGEQVSPASVKRAVRGVRTVLGDSGSSQAAIRTVVGGGYQFMLPVRAPAPVGPPAAPLVGSPHPLGDFAADEPFVGRELFLRVLEASLCRAEQSQGGVMLLGGEAGIGKTFLAQELARRARARGLDVLTGCCFEVEGAPAYWPWLQILRQCVDGHGAARARQWMGRGLAEVADALPELRDLLQDTEAAPAIERGHARFRLFDSLTQFFLRASRERPLLIIIDDLQRADQPSLRLLLFVSRQLAAAKILIVGTIRAGHGRDAQVLALLSELTRSSVTRSLSLPGLGADELARYLELSCGEPPSPAAVSAVHELTAGNPLFLRQLVQCMRAAGAGLCARWLERPGIDASLREAIERRLEGLDPESSALLQVASVIGREFSLGVLAHAAALPVTQVLDALAAATRHGLLRAAAAGRHCFVHALIRDACYQRLDVAARSRFHGRVACALEAQHDCVAALSARSAAELAELAHHSMQAAPAHDERRALAYSVAAAESCLAGLAYEEAAFHYQQALRALALHGADLPQELALTLALGEALSAADQFGPARAALERAVLLARQVGDLDAMTQAAIAMSKPLEMGHLDLPRMQLLEEVLARLPEGDARRPPLRAMLAKSMLFGGEHARRAAFAREALQEARALADPGVLAETLQHAQFALSEPEQLEDRRAVGEELVRLARRQSDRRLLIRGRMAQLLDACERADLDGMDAAIASLSALARHVREPYYRWIANSFRTTRLILAGRFAEAERLADKSRSFGLDLEPAGVEHQWACQTIGIWSLQGRLDKALPAAREVCALYPSISGWSAVLASMEANTGKVEYARSELARLLGSDLSQAQRDPYVLSTLAPLAELCAGVGDAQTAARLYPLMLPYADLLAVIGLGFGSHGPVVCHLAALSHRMGQLDVAEAHFVKALAMTERMPCPPYLAITCRGYALMLARRGKRDDRSRASKLLGRALALAEALGMFGLRDNCRGLARRYELSLGSAGGPQPEPPVQRANPT